MRDTLGKPTMIFYGYDPGGNDKHGVSILEVDHEKAVSFSSATLHSAEAVIRWFEVSGPPDGMGVDTLTCWGTGSSGWRPADRWLRQRYPDVRGSIAAANSLYGSMSTNGMAVLLELRKLHPAAVISETHPKVLHWWMTQVSYDFESRRQGMMDALAKEIGLELSCASDHEWDAAISALAAFRGVTGQWQHDLHTLPMGSHERLVMPCGPTKYFWPE